MRSHHIYDESYVPPPTGVNKQIAHLEEEVDDLEKCLAGNPTSKTWQQINIKLTNKKDELRLKIRSLHTHGPETSVTGESRP
jgi:hypothetical protein